MLILIDLDGVLADFEQGFYEAWQARGHAHKAIPLEDRRCFYIKDDYPRHLRKEVEAIYTAPGFYRNLPPIAGAIKSINGLLALGHDVRICTSPLNAYRHCVLEKYEWVENHLGSEFIARMVVTKDKTLVHGDILIDDKPEITGICTPTWRHILFDQPYNRHVKGNRITWDNWRLYIGS